MEDRRVAKLRRPAAPYDFLYLFDPGSPELVQVYLEAVKDVKQSIEEPELLVRRKAVGRFIDAILESLIVSTDDRFEMLREGLIYLTAFLMDPPHKYAEHEKLVLTQTSLLADEAASLVWSICRGKLREDIAEGRNILLHDLLEKINRAKAELKKLHVEIPGLSGNNVPQTNRRGFFDFLLGNLTKKSEAEADFFPFEKHLIAIVLKELISLRPFLMEIFDQQDGHEELKDIWFKASHVAYLVDLVTDFCLSIATPIWSNLTHLSNAIEHIQFVKTDVAKLRKNQMMSNKRAINDKINSKLVLPGQEQANLTTKDTVMVGFKDEESRVFDRLIGGEEGLDIVAIVSMPGQGKTTLAHRVFHDSRIQYHFHKRAWCCISQTYDIKEKLLEILKDVDKPFPKEQVPHVTREELAERLYRCLKGKTYIVVFDDIWDIKAWNELRESFPDDNMGSRILITSRIRRVAFEAKPKCCLVELHPLSSEESWTLLQVKLFEDGCPPILSEIGKKIAESCKGLPLAIVVIAGILRKDMNVDTWKRIYESLKSQLLSEGCMSILELSYKHLPEHLRPCFLYLGAFREDQIVDAKRLMELWIAEGFVQNEGLNRLETVANDYLKDLVARNLIFVAKRSSRYGIKKCRVHDLLHELCLIRAEEERFLLKPDAFVHSSSIRYDHYRLCVQNKWRPFFDSNPIDPNLRSLLVADQLDMFSSLDHGFSRFKLLKVLNLDGVVIGSDGIKEITKLLHLRFLSVCSLSSFSRSIVNLSRLEVFHFYSLSLLSDPTIAGVLEMTNLRHIFVKGCLLEAGDDEEQDMSPPLTNLETFTCFPFDNKSDFEAVVQKLPNVRKLGVRLNGFCVRFSSYFNKLESLMLTINSDISPSLLDFPSILKKLNLTGYRNLPGIMISSIGKISNLEVLKLKVDFEDKRWNVEDDEFLNLKYLKLSRSNIKEWNASEGCFPLLQQLVLKNCDELRELPCRFGVIPTLKRIGVRQCNPAISTSFEEIVNDQKDNGNEDLQTDFVEPDRKTKLIGLDLPLSDGWESVSQSHDASLSLDNLSSVMNLENSLADFELFLP